MVLHQGIFGHLTLPFLWKPVKSMLCCCFSPSTGKKNRLSNPSLTLLWNSYNLKKCNYMFCISNKHEWFICFIVILILYYVSDEIYQAINCATCFLCLSFLVQTNKLFHSIFHHSSCARKVLLSWEINVACPNNCHTLFRLKL